VASRGLEIKLVSCVYSVLQTILKIAKKFAFGFALEKKEVFYSELLIFAPS
jgi:hypothetical protein